MPAHLDPVCGAQVEQDSAIAESEYLGVRYYFCSMDCKHKFDQRPEAYVHKSGYMLPDEDRL